MFRPIVLCHVRLTAISALQRWRLNIDSVRVNSLRHYTKFPPSRKSAAGVREKPLLQNPIVWYAETVEEERFQMYPLTQIRGGT